MASLLARLWTRLCPKRASYSIMIVGLDNSGKTSVMNKLASLNVASSEFSSSSDFINETTNRSEVSATPTNKTVQDFNFGSSDSRSVNNIMPTVGYNYERIQYKSLAMTVLDFSGQNRYRNLWQEFFSGVDAIVFVIDSSDLIRLVVVRDELETMLAHPYFTTLQPKQQQQADMKRDQFYPLSSNVALYPQKQITISQGKLIQTPLDTSGTSSSSMSPFGLSTRQSCNNQTGSSLPSSTSSSKRRNRVPILFLANKTDLPNSVDTEVIKKALNLNELSTDRHPWFIQATSVNQSQGIVEGFDWLASQLLV